MKKTQPKPLNVNDGFEPIVNAGTHERQKQEHKRVRRMLLTIVVMQTAILVNMILWLLNVIPAVPSLWITGICGCVATFLAGRLWEVAKR